MIMGKILRILRLQPRSAPLKICTLLACALVVTGCGDSSSSDGDKVAIGVTDPETNERELFGLIELPTDLVLNLCSKDAGITGEFCVLDDGNNPFRNTPTREFDVNNPDAIIKFDLAADIPPGPSGAKARFYFWATALARRPSGENQYLTAQALHELYTAGGDPIIREQALKAYRSVLDNFLGSVIVFECCGEFFLPPPGRDPVPFPILLSQLTLEKLRRPDLTSDSEFYPNGFTPLLPEDLTTVALPEPGCDIIVPSIGALSCGLIDLSVREELLEWGFVYTCTGDPELCTVSVAEF